MSELPDASGLGWWICGPAEYTVEVLPRRGPDDKGHVYGLMFANGLVKVGCTAKPRERVHNIRSSVRIYGGSPLEAVGLSHPTARHREIEARLHDRFAGRHHAGELYRVTLAEVANAIAGDRMIAPPTGRRRGRPPTRWWNANKLCWYTTIDGRQIRLGSGEEEAANRFAALMMESGRWDDLPAPGTGEPAMAGMPPSTGSDDS